MGGRDDGKHSLCKLRAVYDAADERIRDRSMKVLVTGATGQVGNAVARALHQRGDTVVALARDPGAAAELLPRGVTAVRGDVTDPASLRAAADGCELVFNAMGIPEQWTRDDGVFERVNARGSEAVVRAAREAGARRVVHTSTIDVFDAEPGARFDESRLATGPKPTAYERSKQHAEELVLAARGEMELVLVNPSAVYGGGPGSASLDKQLFEPVARGRLPVLTPGGMGVVHASGAAAGHLLAAERGRDGERYILSDRHVTLAELARTVVRVAGRGRVPPTLPVPVAHAVAALGDALAALTGIPPLISRGQLSFTLWNAAPDSTRAQEELGWEPTPLEDGIRAALA
jgi:nucleoside-diphosphate-sugar epimerase